MRFQVLGPLEVTEAGRPVPVVGRRLRELLAMLLLHANRLVPVNYLVDVTWPEGPPRTARRQVQNRVGQLRRVLAQGGAPPDVITTLPGGYRLCADEDQVDVLAFARRVAEGRRAAAAERLPEAVTALRGALELWRGRALAEFDCEALTNEAVRLEERRLAVLEECLRLELTLGRHHEVTYELAALAREHPLREGLWAMLLAALYRDGRKAEALAAYGRARETFVAELGLEPGPELRALERAILTEDRLLDRPAAQPPERPRPCQLPPDVADFVGREEVVERLKDLCRTGRGGYAVAVSVLAGKAGIGKTTLAVHVAHALREVYPDGQLYVNLRGADHHQAEPAEVLGRFLRALGVEGSAIPQGLDERAEMYREQLADRRMMVVLDNAGDEAQVQPLLPGAPSCAVLVTSRHRLAGLPGARLVELDVLERDQAVELLSRIAGADRIASEVAAARTLAGLCGRLPLALRIVAARLATRPHWTLAEMAGRLMDERRRLDELVHGGLAVRTSLALSYRNLQPRPRKLLHLLGLLEAPDFPAWVGAALLDATIAEAGELIDQLVDAQLVDVSGRDATGQVRYRLHDLVRLFTRERAEIEEDRAERTAAVARVLGDLLALTETAHRTVHGGDYAVLHGTAERWPAAAGETGLPGRGEVAEPGRVVQTDPLSWYDAERLSIVAGVRQAAEAGLDELCWDLAASAASLFLTRGHDDDWEVTFTRALEATRRAGNLRGTAVTLTGLGMLWVYQHRHAEAVTALDEAIKGFEDVGDRHGLLLALPLVAHVEGMRGRYERAIARHQEAIVVLRALGDQGAEILALRSMSQLLIDIGRPEEARPHLRQAMAAGGEGDRRARAEVLSLLGDVHLGAGEVDRAESAFQDMLEIAEGLGDSRSESAARYGLGLVRLRTDRLDEASTLLGQALSLARKVADRFMEARVRLPLGEVDHRRQRAEEAIAHLRESARITAELGIPLWRARALKVLGDVHAVGGDQEAARAAWGQAHALFTDIGSPEARGPASRLSPTVAAGCWNPGHLR